MPVNGVETKSTYRALVNENTNLELNGADAPHEWCTSGELRPRGDHQLDPPRCGCAHAHRAPPLEIHSPEIERTPVDPVLACPRREVAPRCLHCGQTSPRLLLVEHLPPAMPADLLKTRRLCEPPAETIPASLMAHGATVLGQLIRMTQVHASVGPQAE